LGLYFSVPPSLFFPQGFLESTKAIFFEFLRSHHFLGICICYTISGRPVFFLPLNLLFWPPGWSCLPIYVFGGAPILSLSVYAVISLIPFPSLTLPFLANILSLPRPSPNPFSFPFRLHSCLFIRNSFQHCAKYSCHVCIVLLLFLLPSSIPIGERKRMKFWSHALCLLSFYFILFYFHFLLLPVD